MKEESGVAGRFAVGYRMLREQARSPRIPLCALQAYGKHKKSADARNASAPVAVSAVGYLNLAMAAVKPAWERGMILSSTEKDRRKKPG